MGPVRTNSARTGSSLERDARPAVAERKGGRQPQHDATHGTHELGTDLEQLQAQGRDLDRKSTRLNSSHLVISYAVFCLKKKKKTKTLTSQHKKSTLVRHHTSSLSQHT